MAAVWSAMVVFCESGYRHHHAATWLRLCPSQRRPRHTGATGLARPQEHPAHRALHRVVAASVQGLLALIVGDRGIDLKPLTRTIGSEIISHIGATRASTTLADFSRARDSQISFSVTHGWSAFWRGRPWLAGHRIGETSSDVGSSRFWIGWVTKHGDKCARSTCRD